MNQRLSPSEFAEQRRPPTHAAVDIECPGFSRYDQCVSRAELPTPELKARLYAVGRMIAAAEDEADWISPESMRLARENIEEARFRREVLEIELVQPRGLELAAEHEVGQVVAGERRGGPGNA